MCDKIEALKRLIERGGSRSTDKLATLMIGIDDTIKNVESVEEVSLTWIETSTGELLPNVNIKGLKLK